MVRKTAHNAYQIYYHLVFPVIADLMEVMRSQYLTKVVHRCVQEKGKERIMKNRIFGSFLILIAMNVFVGYSNAGGFIRPVEKKVKVIHQSSIVSSRKWKNAISVEHELISDTVVEQNLYAHLSVVESEFKPNEALYATSNQEGRYWIISGESKQIIMDGQLGTIVYKNEDKSEKLTSVSPNSRYGLITFNDGDDDEGGPFINSLINLQNGACLFGKELGIGIYSFIGEEDRWASAVKSNKSGLIDVTIDRCIIMSYVNQKKGARSLGKSF
jgi:hypothetical protein